MEQGFATPKIHYDLARWLEQRWKEGDTRLLLMAFRSFGKSTIVGLFSAWLLLFNPNLRIMVLAAESNLARKMVRNCRKIIEKHPLTFNLIPDHVDQWAADRFTVKRTQELRDPSVLAAGVTMNITGCRADIIIYDDVEVPNTSDTPDKRENLRERLDESRFILTPNGTQLFVGTPHHYFSIYADQPREEIGEERAYLQDYKRYFQPILNQNGQSVWPEHLTQKAIDLLKTQSGPNKFAAQMMLQPVNIKDSRLDVSKLNFYEDTLDYHEAQGQPLVKLLEKNIVSAQAWWDPAFGKTQTKTKGDNSVCAIIFGDDEGHLYLHHLEYIKLTHQDKKNEAAAQCKIIAGLARQYYLPSITIETNGLGKFLPELLRNEIAKQKIPCAVIEHCARQNKETRILEAFDARLAARALSVHQSVKQTPFMTEMMDWQASGHNKDDGLDAVAGAISQEPIRLKRSYFAARQNWQGSKMIQAPSDFKV